MGIFGWRNHIRHIMLPSADLWYLIVRMLSYRDSSYPRHSCCLLAIAYSVILGPLYLWLSVDINVRPLIRNPGTQPVSCSSALNPDWNQARMAQKESRYHRVLIFYATLFNRPRKRSENHACRSVINCGE